MCNVMAGKEYSRVIAEDTGLMQHAPEWMREGEQRAYAAGIVAKRWYTAAQLAVTYIRAQLTDTVAFALHQPDKHTGLLVVFEGRVCVHAADNRSCFCVGAREIGMYTVPQQAAELVLPAGSTEALLFTVTSDFIQPLMAELDQLAARLYNSNSCPVTDMDYYTEHALCRKLMRSAPGRLSGIRIKHAIYSLLVHYEERLNAPAVTTGAEERYREVITQIRTEIENKPDRSVQTEAFFAAKYGMGEVTLSRYFKVITGVSLAAFRNDCCMIRARELIKSGMRIQEIAALLGYTEQAAFTKAFRTYYGRPPSEYRQRNDNDVV